MLENMIERLPVALVLVLFIAGLICYLISQRPALSKKEEKELKKLDDIISETYGFKK